MSDAAYTPTRMAWLDVETTGLDPARDGCLEIGWYITDLDLNVLNKRKWLVWDEWNSHAARNRMGEYVRDMHTRNGLLPQARLAGEGHDLVEDSMVAWLTSPTVDIEREGKLPISGSSPALDIGVLMHQFPKVYELFHYRVIDNSTMKEMCRRYNPKLYEKRPDMETDHRVFTCLDGTLAEAKFYLDNFIFDGRDDD